MKRTLKRQAMNLCLLLFTTLWTALSGAQLTDSLSQPLDSNLNGPSSAVAPTTSTEIEPGANNLLAPDEHVLPYDAIGASIVATPLSPAVTQYDQLARTPFQIDGSIRDASVLTGQRSLTPLNIVDLIARRPGQFSSSALSQAPGSSFGSAPMLSVKSLPVKTSAMTSGGVLQGPMTLQSSWKIGGSPAASAINPLQQAAAAQADSPSEHQSAGGEDKSSTSLLNKKLGDRGVENAAVPSTADKPQDYSRSPLEASENQEPVSADIAASPFESLDQNSFLNPDITAPTTRRNAFRRQAGTSFSNREQLGFSARTQATFLQPQPRTTEMMREGISPAESRLMRQTQRDNQMKRPTWHNPILQQMEDDANSDRQ